MLELKYRTPELEKQSKGKKRIYLVANIGKTHQLFQGQSLNVKTGVAIKSDQHVFAAALSGLNRIGLVMGSGMQLLDTDGEGEIEITIWNRNQQGQQRMIEIDPGMPIAELIVMPKYCQGLTEVKEKKPAEKLDLGQEKPATPVSINKRPEDMSKAELKEALDNAKVAYKVKDTQDVLIELVHGAYTGGG